MNAITNIQIAALVRNVALNTTGRLLELDPPKSDAGDLILLEEFLAFYSVMACRFIYMFYEIKDPDEVQRLYQNLIHALQNNLNDKLDSAMESCKIEAGLELMISLQTVQKSFTNEFWALWNADLNSLRITLEYLGELAKIGIVMPSEDKTEIACFAIIVRSARKNVSGGKNVADAAVMPSLSLIDSCRKIVFENGQVFNDAINEIMLNEFRRSA